MSTTAWLAPARYLSPDRFELWLERKAARGQMLRDVDRLTPVRMRFDDAPPAQVRYVVDQRATPTPADYFTSREQRGWEHVGALADLHVWRREYAGERPDGFIGRDALTKRAATAGLGSAIVAVVALLGAVALAVATAVADLGVDSPRALWAPAVALGVVAVLAAIAAAQLGVSGGTKRARETPALISR